MSQNNVRMNENADCLEIATIDQSEPGKFTKRLQFFSLSPDSSGIMKICKKAEMISEPPICPFASDWRFMNKELVFFSNERIPTKSRTDPDWQTSSEVMLTTMNFVSVDYETGLIYRDRQEKAYGVYNWLPNYNPEDWARENWGTEPWVKFSRLFLSNYYLAKGKYESASSYILNGNAFSSSWF